MLLNSNIVLKDIKWSESINYCKRIVWGKSPIFIPRIALAKNSSKMKINRFNKIYCMSMKITDIDLYIFKVYRFIIMKMNDMISKIYIKYILIKNKHCLYDANKGEKNE